MSWSSASVGLRLSERITVPSSLVVMAPSLSLSKREKASLNSAICSSVSWSACRERRRVLERWKWQPRTRDELLTIVIYQKERKKKVSLAHRQGKWSKVSLAEWRCSSPFMIYMRGLISWLSRAYHAFPLTRLQSLWVWKLKKLHVILCIAPVTLPYNGICAYINRFWISEQKRRSKETMLLLL